MPKIQSLHVNSFRGIVDEELPFDGHSVVLLGENGSGKSSFVDALQFFFQGRVDHLEGAQGISTTQHGPHIHASPEQVRIEVRLVGGQSPVIRAFAGMSQVAPELQPYLDLGAGCTYILRRQNILNFILARPADRYTQLAAIIGIDDLDKIERTLMQAKDDLAVQRDALARQVHAQANKLRDTLGTSVATDVQILEALNLRLSEMGHPPIGSWDKVEQYKETAIRRSRVPMDMQRALKLQGALTQIDSLRQVSLIDARYDDLCRLVGTLQGDAERLRQLAFRELLAASRQLVIEMDLDYCPVCLRPIVASDLLASLDERVRESTELMTQVEGIRHLRSEIADEIEARKTSLAELVQASAQLGLQTKTKPLLRTIALLDQLLKLFDLEPWGVRLPSADELRSSPPAQELADVLDKLSEALIAERARQERTEQDELTVRVIDLLTKTDETRQAIRKGEVDLNIKAGTANEMESVYLCFVSTKQQQIKAIYNALQEDICRFYGILHKGDGCTEVELEIDEDRRASTDIRTNFYDREQEDPRSFNSEGHLDSLGLCIFLAFVKRFNAGFPLIVLDDVVSSIDSGHRRLICDLLSEEFADYQLFITTHDYIWFEELCAHQRAKQAQHKFNNLQITEWTLDDGPRLNKYRPRWERIEDRLIAGDRDGAAADTRKELESFVYEMCIDTLTPLIPKRDGRYVLSETLDPFVKHLKGLVPKIYADNLPVIQAVNEDGIFGNLLVHNNPRAGNVSLDEVRAFVKAVRDFENLFTCEKGHLVMYYRDALVIKCKCGAISWAIKG
ncbi:MAG: AAA family ATPase [Anaerolineae bacterium]